MTSPAREPGERVLVNGLAAASVSVSDRGLQYGDGLFETISCLEGEPRWLELHLQRLQQGCLRLGIQFTAMPALRAEILELARGARCMIKVILTRGPALARGYRPVGGEVPTRIVSRHDWTAGPSRPQGSGFRVGVSAVRLGRNPLLAGLKHLNRLEQVLAQRAMQTSDVELDEVLMLTGEHEVICASSANVFFVDTQGVFTPAVDECGIAGVMRRVTLEAAAAAGRPIAIRRVQFAELAQISEMFVTNVRLGLQTVGWLDDRALPGHSEARALEDLIHATHR